MSSYIFIIYAYIVGSVYFIQIAPENKRVAAVNRYKGVIYMSCVDVSGNTTPMALFTCPSHNKFAIKAIIANNESTTPKVVYIRDVFTPASTNGTASPTQVAKRLLAFTVDAETHTVLDSKQLGDGELECMGAVDASTNIADASMNIAVVYGPIAEHAVEKSKKSVLSNWIKAVVFAVVTIILNLISNLLYDKNIIAVVWGFIKSLQL